MYVHTYAYITRIYNIRMRSAYACMHIIVRNNKQYTNRFQDELHNFSVRFGTSSSSDATSSATRFEMTGLTPYGFLVGARSAEADDSAVTNVHVPFETECRSAADFQQQILKLSRQCLRPAV
jgi:hypothetical protein